MSNAEPVIHLVPPGSPRAAGSTAKFAHSLWGLIHAGATLAQALDAIARQRRADHDPDTAIYQRLARAVRDFGLPLYTAVQAERPFFSIRMGATLALGNLGGALFKTFVRHLGDQARQFLELPPQNRNEFPVVVDEFREFFFFLGHLLIQRAPPDEVQRWLPLIFSPAFRGDVTYTLMRFFDKGLRLAEALRLSRCFQDEEIITQVEAAEKLNMLSPILVDLPDWLDLRRRLDEQLRFGDMLSQRQASIDPGRNGGR